MTITLIELFRVLLDFGLVVLIWIVQLVIYPGLCRYGTQDLKTWHAVYMRRVGTVVMPLMVGQLAVVIYQAIRVQTSYTLGSLFLVAALWAITFFIFVPLHHSVDASTRCGEVTQKLVRRNWSRTFLWSLLFLWTLIQLLIEN